MHDLKHEIHSRFPVILHDDLTRQSGSMIKSGGTSTHRKAPYSRPSDPTAIRTKRQRLEDVRPAPEPPVNMHRDPPIRRLHTLWQGVQGGHHAVKLPAAMVAHDDPVASVFDRQRRVFGGEHPFDPYLHLRPRLQPRYLPRPAVRVVVESGEPGVVGPGPDLFRGPFDDGEFESPREPEVVPPLVVPDPEDGGVGGQEDGLAAGRFRLADDGFFERAVAHRVQLDGVVHGAYIRRRGPDGFDVVV